MITFFARHWLHAALNFALRADREPISFLSILMSLLVLLSIPLGYLAAKRAVIFVRVSQYFLFFLNLNFFFVSPLAVSTKLGHHHAINASLFKAFFALGVIITSDNDFVNLSIASKTLDSRLDSLENVARTLCVHLLPLIINLF